MEQFDELLVRYDGLIQKALAHMRIYENFEEFYQIITIELWLATTTYCTDKSVCFLKYEVCHFKGADTSNEGARHSLFGGILCVRTGEE